MIPNATFGSLGGLKRRMMEQHRLQFCDLCIKGRKVFISEQMLYTKPDLHRHLKTGDDAGPLAESGFKGHPLCRFCRKHFYDGDELYKHMEGQHEHCFICRKQHPNKFVYYKDYAELEEHFRGQHNPCPHPDCLDRKFVVFSEESELKRHFALEHGNEANLSRAQRRNMLSINIPISYASQQEQEAIAAATRPGIVIGGGHNLPRRGGGMRHSRSDGAMAAAVNASIESSQVETAMRQSAAAAQQAQTGPSSVTFSAEDFPTVSGQGSSGATPLGTWVGNSAGPMGGRLNQEDFPALPIMSRNQRRKQRERERSTASTLAGRLAAAGAPIRVVNRAQAGSPAAAAAAPAAGPSSSNSSTGLVRHSSSTGNLASSASTAGEQSAASDDSGAENSDTGGIAQDDFPALGGAAAPATQAHPAWVPVRRSKNARSAQTAAASSRASRSAAAPSISDFPSLAATIPSRQTAAKPPVAAKRSGNSSTSVPAPQQSVAAAVAAAGGVSDELKAANKALIERCKAALSEEGFQDFRQQSAAFMQGAMSAEDYHSHVVQLGLASLVPQLAALCPDEDKRSALVAAHKQHLESGTPSSAGGRGWVPPEAAMAALQEVEQKGSWPCERCTLVNAPSSRMCEVCSAPRRKVSKAAAGRPSSSSSGNGVGGGGSSSSGTAVQRPPVQWAAAAAGGAAAGGASSSTAAKSRSAAAAAPVPAAPPASAESWPTLGGGPADSSASNSSSAADPVQQQQEPDDSSSSASTSQQGGRKKKAQKQTLQQLLAAGKSHPQNAWSQQQRVTQVAAPAGQWGKAGGSKLAKNISAVNNAWSK
eukprot:GHUV01028280.1.p1 GENE.GHUV01028280.1~~GHUV01028280.1.p1  ORF type:complete len:820 (+),score=339.54 GHUV01028280.1:679-3138(+)